MLWVQKSHFKNHRSKSILLNPWSSCHGNCQNLKKMPCVPWQVKAFLSLLLHSNKKPGGPNCQSQSCHNHKTQVIGRNQYVNSRVEKKESVSLKKPLGHRITHPWSLTHL